MRRLLLIALLLAVAGCGSAAATPPADPTALVGWWRVAGAEQRVLVSPEGIEVLDGCATFTGTWRADVDGRFVAGVDITAPCSDGPAPEPPTWLAAAGAFRLDGAERVVLDRAGQELVRLVPEPPFEGSGMVDPSRVAEPAVPAAPVPDGWTGADVAGLTGRWNAGDVAFVEFDPAGSWTGSDGCNGTGGSWTGDGRADGGGPGRVGPAGDGTTDGGFLATGAAVRTLIACDGSVDVGAQLAVARRAAFDGDALVLLDAAGAPVGRFTR